MPLHKVERKREEGLLVMCVQPLGHGQVTYIHDMMKVLFVDNLITRNLYFL